MSDSADRAKADPAAQSGRIVDFPGRRARASSPAKGALRSLRIYNYRLWSAGALVSNVGTWVQRIAQDWLVLTQLTPHSATAVGIVMALQTLPSILLMAVSGLAADRLDRRKLLIATQAGMGGLALVLGLLTVTHTVRLWEVDAIALLLGCVSAFDQIARHTFVSDLVGDEDLANAVALNSSSFNIARLLGPAAAGFLIAVVGCGWAFLVNAASFAAVLGSLLALRRHELRVVTPAVDAPNRVTEGFRYVLRNRDLRALMLMLFLIGSFGLNFPIILSTMSVSVFHKGAGQYGLLNSICAAGALAGGVIAARWEIPDMRGLSAAAAIFGFGFAAAALSPDYWSFAACLVIVGAAALIFSTGSNSYAQLAATPDLRGRVIAIRMALGIGGTVVGAPLVGWVVDAFGPRWGAGVAAVSGLAAASVAALLLAPGRGARDQSLDA